MKIYLFELCVNYESCEIKAVCLKRETAEDIMGKYVEAEAKAYDTTQKHKFADSYSWNVEEMEVIE